MDNRPISAWSPGYSADGQVAMVVISFPWSSMHGGNATYVLALEDGRWRIILREFKFYV
jgi:hypothetical protein